MKDFKRPLLMALCTLPLLALAFVGTSYALYASKLAPDALKATTANIRTELIFALNGNMGIPGETLVIAEEGGNNVRKAKGSADYIFCMTYEVNYLNGGKNDYIKDLWINESTAGGQTLIKAGEYDTATQTLTYYGRHRGEEELFLGELLATFNILKNPSMGKLYDISACIEVCQATEDATDEIFGINSTIGEGRYASLFE